MIKDCNPTPDKRSDVGALYMFILAAGELFEFSSDLYT